MDDFFKESYCPFACSFTKKVSFSQEFVPAEEVSFTAYDSIYYQLQTKTVFYVHWLPIYIKESGTLYKKMNLELLWRSRLARTIP